MGSELSAASGRRSEASEWLRSKFQASAVRQRRNFGHRNRIIGPYGGGYKGYSKTGRRGRRPLRMRYKKCRWAGRCRHRPLRRVYKGYSKTGRRGNRRSAASGRRSEAVSRKCPDWRTRQWPGIGWHDGGQPPAPTKFCVSVFFLAKIF